MLQYILLGDWPIGYKYLQQVIIKTLRAGVVLDSLTAYSTAIRQVKYACFSLVVSQCYHVIVHVVYSILTITAMR